MIPWDDDADCCVLEEDFRKFITVIAVLLKLGYSMNIVNGGWKGVKVCKPGVFDLDVFVMCLKDELYVYPTGWPHMTLIKKQIFPLKKVQFGHIQINAPQDIDSFLTQNFGDNWRTHAVKYNHSNLLYTPRIPILLAADELLPAGPLGPIIDNSDKIAEPCDLDLNVDEIIQAAMDNPS